MLPAIWPQPEEPGCAPPGCEQPPFHSSLLSPAGGEKLAAILDQVEIKAPEIPVVANVTGGDYVTTGEDIRESLVRQVSSPVRWEDSIRRMLLTGITLY